MSSPLDRLHNEAIEEYLDQFCAQLSAMPEERQMDLRTELHQHLELLLTEQVDCETVSTAVLLGRLVQRFGDPGSMGRAVAQQWLRSSGKAVARDTLASEPKGLLVAFGVFTFTSLVFSCMWQPMMQHFHYTLLDVAIAGPIIPLLAGALWGRQDGRPRNDYLGLPLLSLLCLMATSFVSTLPDLPIVNGRLFFLLLWTLIACGACGAVRSARLWCDLFREDEKTESPL